MPAEKAGRASERSSRPLPSNSLRNASLGSSPAEFIATSLRQTDSQKQPEGEPSCRGVSRCDVLPGDLFQESAFLSRNTLYDSQRLMISGR